MILNPEILVRNQSKMEFKFVAVLLAILFAVSVIAPVKSDDMKTGKKKKKNNIKAEE